MLNQARSARGESEQGQAAKLQRLGHLSSDRVGVPKDRQAHSESAEVAGSMAAHSPMVMDTVLAAR